MSLISNLHVSVLFSDERLSIDFNAIERSIGELFPILFSIEVNDFDSDICILANLSAVWTVSSGFSIWKSFSLTASLILDVPDTGYPASHEEEYSGLSRCMLECVIVFEYSVSCHILNYYLAFGGIDVVLTGPTLFHSLDSRLETLCTAYDALTVHIVYKLKYHKWMLKFSPMKLYGAMPFFFKEDFINESNAFTKYYEAIKKNGCISKIIEQVENMGDYCDLFNNVSGNYIKDPINLLCDPIPDEERK
ncbi:hypothetical protein NQ317_004033 [Molorchus minor]|uniref:Uncharacterized protein n=1 Tax=Molorchus minor TaxID=1323400 RepID=A0ABQ9JTR8_9CUCU|nr:hypothetical protein NQ317_004033 [Molorchus minor]